MSTLTNMKKRSWWDRLNVKLYPYLGPAQLGVAGEAAPPVTRADRGCPLCGQPMSRHVIDRPGGNVAHRLHCPVAAA